MHLAKMIDGIFVQSRVCSQPFESKKLLILNMNGVLCYFPQYVISQDNVRVFGRNIDKSKIEVRVIVEHFLANAFQKFYIIIWSCMKLKDVLEVLPMLMPKSSWISLCLFGDVNNVQRLLLKFLLVSIII